LSLSIAGIETTKSREMTNKRLSFSIPVRQDLSVIFFRRPALADEPGELIPQAQARQGSA
jgi:hypothetical protein